MNFKMVFSGCLVLLFVFVLSACRSESENDKPTELSLKEAKIFATGFLYVRSPFESRKEEEDFNIKEIERVAKANNMDLYIYRATDDTSKLGLKQNSLTCAFYQNGEVKEKLDFVDISVDDIPSEVETFVQSVKQNFLK